MIATLHLVADHGDLLAALPFAAPAILVFGGLMTVLAHDRLRGR